MPLIIASVCSVLKFHARYNVMLKQVIYSTIILHGHSLCRKLSYCYATYKLVALLFTVYLSHIHYGFVCIDVSVQVFTVVLQPNQIKINIFNQNHLNCPWRNTSWGCQDRTVDLVKTMVFEYISFMGFCLDIDCVSLQFFCLLCCLLLYALILLFFHSYH